MKLHLILFSILTCAAGTLQPLQAQQPKTADEVVAIMIARDGIRRSASGGYIGRREYVLENLRLQKRAQMAVRVHCDQDGTKHFEVLSEDGWKSANKRVLREMLVTESDNSQPEIVSKSRITSDNYSFRMIEASPVEGRLAYVIEVIPKRQDKLLFRGRIWIDAEDYALARVEGEPAQNPSFWTRKVHFVQQYQKNGPFWFPVMTTSDTDARIFGATHVDIRYFGYTPMSLTSALATAPSIEASNEK